MISQKIIALTQYPELLYLETFMKGELRLGSLGFRSSRVSPDNLNVFFSLFATKVSHKHPMVFYAWTLYGFMQLAQQESPPKKYTQQVLKHITSLEKLLKHRPEFLDDLKRHVSRYSFTPVFHTFIAALTVRNISGLKQMLINPKNMSVDAVYKSYLMSFSNMWSEDWRLFLPSLVFKREANAFFEEVLKKNDVDLFIKLAENRLLDFSGNPAKFVMNFCESCETAQNFLLVYKAYPIGLSAKALQQAARLIFSLGTLREDEGNGLKLLIAKNPAAKVYLAQAAHILGSVSGIQFMEREFTWNTDEVRAICSAALVVRNTEWVEAHQAVTTQGNHARVADFLSRNPFFYGVQSLADFLNPSAQNQTDGFLFRLAVQAYPDFPHDIRAWVTGADTQQLTKDHLQSYMLVFQQFTEDQLIEFWKEYSRTLSDTHMIPSFQAIAIMFGQDKLCLQLINSFGLRTSYDLLCSTLKPWFVDNVETVLACLPPHKEDNVRSASLLSLLEELAKDDDLRPLYATAALRQWLEDGAKQFVPDFFVNLLSVFRFPQGTHPLLSCKLSIPDLFTTTIDCLNNRTLTISDELWKPRFSKSQSLSTEVSPELRRRFPEEFQPGGLFHDDWKADFRQSPNYPKARASIVKLLTHFGTTQRNTDFLDKVSRLNAYLLSSNLQDPVLYIVLREFTVWLPHVMHQNMDMAREKMEVFPSDWQNCNAGMMVRFQQIMETDKMMSSVFDCCEKAVLGNNVHEVSGLKSFIPGFFSHAVQDTFSLSNLPMYSLFDTQVMMSKIYKAISDHEAGLIKTILELYQNHGHDIELLLMKAKDTVPEARVLIERWFVDEYSCPSADPETIRDKLLRRYEPALPCLTGSVDQLLSFPTFEAMAQVFVQTPYSIQSLNMCLSTLWMALGNTAPLVPQSFQGQRNSFLFLGFLAELEKLIPIPGSASQKFRSKLWDIRPFVDLKLVDKILENFESIERVLDANPPVQITGIRTVFSYCQIRKRGSDSAETVFKSLLACQAPYDVLNPYDHCMTGRHIETLKDWVSHPARLALFLLKRVDWALSSKSIMYYIVKHDIASLMSLLTWFPQTRFPEVCTVIVSTLYGQKTQACRVPADSEVQLLDWMKSSGVLLESILSSGVEGQTPLLLEWTSIHRSDDCKTLLRCFDREAFLRQPGPDKHRLLSCAKTVKDTASLACFDPRIHIQDTVIASIKAVLNGQNTDAETLMTTLFDQYMQTSDLSLALRKAAVAYGVLCEILNVPTAFHISSSNNNSFSSRNIAPSASEIDEAVELCAPHFVTSSHVNRLMTGHPDTGFGLKLVESILCAGNLSDDVLKGLSGYTQFQFSEAEDRRLSERVALLLRYHLSPYKAIRVIEDRAMIVDVFRQKRLRLSEMFMLHPDLPTVSFSSPGAVYVVNQAGFEYGRKDNFERNRFPFRLIKPFKSKLKSTRVYDDPQTMSLKLQETLYRRQGRIPNVSSKQVLREILRQYKAWIGFDVNAISDKDLNGYHAKICEGIESGLIQLEGWSSSQQKEMLLFHVKRAFEKLVVMDKMDKHNYLLSRIKPSRVFPTEEHPARFLQRTDPSDCVGLCYSFPLKVREFNQLERQRLTDPGNSVFTSNRPVFIFLPKSGEAVPLSDRQWQLLNTVILNWDRDFATELAQQILHPRLRQGVMSQITSTIVIHPQSFHGF